MEEAIGPPVEIWPDNLLAINTFIAAATQWRMGPSGPIGLDYTALPTVLRLTGVARALWTEIFQDIRTLEDAALETMRKK
jgi:hypothetical protein